MLTPADVEAAARRIAPYVRTTPLRPSHRQGLWLKLENEQRSGAFKARGAFAALTALTPEQRARGVVTHSSGNHGRAL
ncbi:MAG: pyridoxal-phosphate dependent enzyme, partial [Jiangellales bacterium]